MKLRETKLPEVLGVLTACMMVASLYGVFKVAPTERIMGDVQRIFYFHVPIAMMSFLAFFIVFVAGSLYLWKKDLRWDRLASCSAEIGLLLTSLVMVTGSLWAKPIWNAWWVWDPRLVTYLILWFTYVGYFMVRAAVTEAGKRARFAAVVGIVGFLDVPIVYFSTMWWKSIHPKLSKQEGGLDPVMLKVLLLSLATFTLLFVWLLWFRAGIEGMKKEVQELKALFYEEG